MKNISFTKKTALIALAVLLLVAAGVFAYFQLNDSPYEQEHSSQDSNIDYGPPNEEEQQAGDEQKKDIVNRVEKEQQPSKPAENADVVITDATQYGNDIEVRAFVSNVYEAGTCTATFTKDGKTVEAESEAFKDASTTQCKGMIVPRLKFPSSGKWNIKVTYQSAGSYGEATSTVKVK